MLDRVDNNKNFEWLRQEKGIKNSDTILAYARENDITLWNLLPREKQVLIGISNEADQAKKQRELDNWKKTLHHAINKKGAHIGTHRAGFAGFRDQYERTGKIAPYTWGTDLDAQHALQAVMVDPKNIKANGRYILSSASGTEQDARVNLENKLKEVLAAAKDLKKVSVNFLINQNNNHWRAVQVEIENGQIIAASLHEPGQNSELNKTLVYRNLNAVLRKLGLKQPVIPVEQRLQRDGYRCLDFSLRTVLLNAGLDKHPIAATGIEGLRQRVIQTILPNVHTVEIDEPAMPSSNHLEEALKEKVFQEEFDDLFVQELVTLFKENPNNTAEQDKQLFNQAKDQVLTKYYKVHGFFSQPNEQSANDVTFVVKPKK